MPYKIRVDTGGTFTDCRGENDSGEVRGVKILSSGRLRVAVGEAISEKEIRLEIPDHWLTPPDFFRGFSVENQIGERAEVKKFFPGGFSGPPRQCDFAGSLDRSLFRRRSARARCSFADGDRTGLEFSRSGFSPRHDPRDQRSPRKKRRITGALYQPVDSATCSKSVIKGGPISSLWNTKSPARSTRRSSKSPPGSTQPARSKFRSISPAQNSTHRFPSFSIVGIRIAAVATLHSYRNPDHEIQLRDFLLSKGFDHVSISSELAPLVKILPRAQTAVANAYLHPVMQTFLDHVQSKTGKNNGVFAMTSSGGLEPAEVFRPKDSLLSGPAAGVAGAAAVAQKLGFERILTFDMGGTSTDVARFDGDFIYRFEQKVGDVNLLSTALKIETVAAGGGSICQWTPLGLRVGPESAGAQPGPACYGKGGPLTITDVNLLLERIDFSNFGIPVGPDQIEAARTEALRLQKQAGLSEKDLDLTFLEGLIDIAVEQMADAIRTISIRDGADPGEYALLAFGGAGPLHACAIAEKLGMEKIIIPGEAGILSASGLDQAAVERIAEIQVNRPLSEASEIDSLLKSVREKAEEKLREIGFSPGRVRFLAEIRITGQDSALALDVRDPKALGSEFFAEYKKTFGYFPPEDRDLELVSLRAVASSKPDRRGYSPPLKRVQSAIKEGTMGKFVDRGGISPGTKIEGPRIIQDPFSTLHLPENWTATAIENGSLLLEKNFSSKLPEENEKTAPAEIAKELFRRRLEHIVTEMGTMLQRSAISTNVKERLDFSCALLDGDGTLVASAHHIPVHLGALGECVRAVKKILPLKRGDTAITNHPGIGGSHLPDVTVITPVFAGENYSEPIAYLANRAHHAEIGGIAPGSMPGNAKNLAEEGVVIFPQYIIRGEKSCFPKIEELLGSGPCPSRRISDNLADLHAQVAANRRGEQLLADLIAGCGASEVEKQMRRLLNQSRDALAQHLQSRKTAGGGEAIQRLDDGTVIRVTISIDGEDKNKLKIDFGGTSEIHPGNLNATPAIVRSAVLYVLRLWTGTNLPLNEGSLADVKIDLPRCFLNPEIREDPSQSPAVVGGNVETSQRIVDTLIRALGIQACSQGTMNNLIFGDDSFGYYETIAGGAGAGDGYHGASALHTHMTNTAITDPEILESRYPVKLNEFSIRGGSGGKGKWNGGDGVVREYTFLRSVTVSLLTQHRKEEPFGMAGGNPGKCGAQFIDGKPIDGSTTIDVKSGQVLRIETPGAGGWG